VKKLFFYFLCTGPYLADARPYANPIVRPPSATVTRKKLKSFLIKLNKAENDDIDALSVPSIKNSKSH